MTRQSPTPDDLPAARQPRHEHHGRPPGAVCLLRAQVFDADDLRRAHTRIAHEIVERNHGADRRRARRPLHAGRRRRPPARRRRSSASRASRVPVGALDVAFYRDDIGLRPVQPLGPDRDPGRHHRAGRGPRRRRALHRPHRPRRPRRPHRARPPPGGAAGGARRPGPPRAADPGRLRRQEPADQGRRGRPGAAAEVDDGEDGIEIWGPRGAGDEAPAVDRRPRPRRASTSCSTCRSRSSRSPSATSRRSRRCGARPS